MIPNNFVGFVTICTDQMEGEFYIEGRSYKQRSIPNCVISVEDGEAQIPVVNISGHELILRKDENVSRAVTCSEEKDNCKKVCNLTISEHSDKDDFKNFVNVSDGVPKETKNELLNILTEFRDCFAMNLKELGCAKNFECVIETSTDEPITFRPYRLSHSERQTVREMIEELKSAGVVVDSNSSYASPILLVKKKTGDVSTYVHRLSWTEQGY